MINLTKSLQSLFLLLMLLCAFSQQDLHAEDDKSIALIEQAQNAIDYENWEFALSSLFKGIQEFPQNGEFHYLLGKVYFHQNLYTSAYPELKLAHKLHFQSSDFLSLLSDTASFLNKDEDALLWIKLHIEMNPHDVFAWSTFGWLCYKTNRLDEGIRALHRVVDSYGPDASVFASLANLYIAEFNYEEAKKYYTQAIALSEERGQSYLASIYYYNRSILEEIFYNFDEAYLDSARSLDSLPRASGYLMRGELDLRKLDFKGALNNYLTAWNTDPSPLATLGLAETLLLAGYPEHALSYLSHAETKKDLSWIANYGTTPEQYKAEVARLSRNCYTFLKNREKCKIIHTLYTWVNKYISILRFTWLEWNHNSKYKIQTKKVAEYYETTKMRQPLSPGQELFLHSFYYNAFSPKFRLASTHLSNARKIETSHILKSEPSYIYEEGLLKHDKGLLNQAIIAFDPSWEKKYLSEALGAVLSLEKDPYSAYYASTAHILFTLSPAAFTYHSALLPVQIKWNSNDLTISFQTKKKFQRLLKKAGIVNFYESPFILEISKDDNNCIVSLINRNNNFTSFTQVFHNFTEMPQDMEKFVHSLSTRLFQTELGIAEMGLKQ